MTTKTITLRAIDLLPGLDSEGEGVPFLWLRNLVTKVQACVPESEEASCLVHGTTGLTFTYEHTLSEVEQLQATVAKMQSKEMLLRALLPLEGGVSAQAADKLRELLK